MATAEVYQWAAAVGQVVAAQAVGVAVVAILAAVELVVIGNGDW